jgi:putative transposase
MPSKKILTPIISGTIYHIFNRGINKTKVFLIPSDYLLFLEKLKKYVNPFANIFGYDLLPNHYHLLLRVNEGIERGEFSHQFKRFILSYTNLINKRESRSGNLFSSVFKRLRVTEDDYFRRLIFYIHYNPQNHKIIERFQDYKYSSYQALISDAPTLMNRQEVLLWFENRQNFIDYHSIMKNEKIIKHLIIE